MSKTDGFPAALRAWRARVGMSQADLDARIGRTPGRIAQIELGRLKAPDRATCARIAEALGVAPAEVWTASREDRLFRSEPEIYADIVAERALRAPAELTEDEWALIRILRALEPGEGPGVIRPLTAITLPLLGDLGGLEKDVPWALAEASNLPQPRLRSLLSGIVRVVEAVVGRTAPRP